MSHRIGNIYCFDTSSFVCLKYSFPLDSWLQPMWGLVDDRAADGRLVAPREVRREINEHYKNDELKDWIRAHENVIREMDDAQEHYMKMIMKKFPNIIDIEAERPNA
ncbi:DUF4411 family protein, partial [bacterium]|nr:DUF4411 family protein [bacterium]